MKMKGDIHCLSPTYFQNEWMRTTDFSEMLEIHSVVESDDNTLQSSTMDLKRNSSKKQKRNKGNWQ